MIRLVNDMNGFSYFNSTNKTALGVDKFPEQRSEFLNTYTTLRYKDTWKFEDKYRFRVPREYKERYKTVTVDEAPGQPTYFRIIRFDNGGPDKAILLGIEFGEIIVAKASELLTRENIDYDFCTRIKRRLEFQKRTYFEPNPILDTDKLYEFFQSYNNEHVYEYPVQDFDLLGRTVWIEYNDSLTQPKSPENTIDKKNDFRFNGKMRENLINGRRILQYYPDDYLAYYPYTYNVHAQSKIDMPRRTTTQGIIIRADVQSTELHIVVMELREDNIVRFVCDDEARFYFDTTVENYGIRFNAADEINQYSIYGVIEEEEDEKEETQPEDTSEEEAEESEEETKEKSYDDVIIHIHSEDIEPEVPVEPDEPEIPPVDPDNPGEEETEEQPQEEPTEEEEG